MSTEQNKEIVRRFLEEAVRGNLDVVDELFGANAVVHDPGRPTPPGPEGQRRTRGISRFSIHGG